MRVRIFRILLLLIPLAIIIVYLFKERSPFGGRNSSFAVDQETEITRIEFTSGDEKLTLERNGEDWLVNGRSEARQSSIRFILRIITGMEIKSPVSPEMFKNEITDRGVTPVRVKVIHGRRILRSFLVYKTGSNNYGNIMKLRERSKPFIVYVPGNEAAIGSAFNTNRLFWEPFTLFELLPSEISSVTIENLADPESSFTIRKENRKFVLSASGGELPDWDTLKVMRYISYFTHVQFESWLPGLTPEEKEKIISGEPLYKISVSRTDGQKTDVRLWERKITENGEEKDDSDRLLGQTGSQDDVFVIRFVDIDPLLKKRSYFYRE